MQEFLAAADRAQQIGLRWKRPRKGTRHKAIEVNGSTLCIKPYELENPLNEENSNEQPKATTVTQVNAGPYEYTRYVHVCTGTCSSTLYP